MAVKRTIVAIGILIAGASVTHYAFRQPTPVGVVIITLDTTRADRLPPYGFSGVATPAIDTVAARGVVFADAVTVAPLTLTAHTSLFTGLYPPRHGVRDNTARPLEPTHDTLAEILHARGFRTGAFVGSAVLAADRGLSRGFDVYDDGGAPGLRPPDRRPGSDVVDRANAWIRSLNGATPFFLWVQLDDVHAPQTLPPEFRRVYGDRYEGAIAYEDAQIARLLDTLRARGLLDRTAIVLAGAHGESLGEHGEKEHGLFVYESTMHVPLIVAAPGLPHGRVSTATSLIDVLPTVLDLFGIGARTVDGRSTVPAIRGEDVPDRPIYGESMYPLHLGSSPLRMIRDGRFKYIDAPKPELYDLQTDRSEMHNLSSERPSIAAVLAGILRDGLSADTQEVRASVLDPERRRTLEALGDVSRR